MHTGHDDATLAMLQDQLDMVKIGKDPSKVPSWLRANKPMIPDFVARDPKVLGLILIENRILYLPTVQPSVFTSRISEAASVGDNGRRVYQSRCSHG